MAHQNELAALRSMGIVSLARKEGLLGGLKPGRVTGQYLERDVPPPGPPPRRGRFL